MLGYIRNVYMHTHVNWICSARLFHLRAHPSTQTKHVRNFTVHICTYMYSDAHTRVAVNAAAAAAGWGVLHSVHWSLFTLYIGACTVWLSVLSVCMLSLATGFPLIRTLTLRNRVDIFGTQNAHDCCCCCGGGGGFSLKYTLHTHTFCCSVESQCHTEHTTDAQSHINTSTTTMHKHKSLTGKAQTHKRRKFNEYFVSDGHFPLKYTYIYTYIYTYFWLSYAREIMGVFDGRRQFFVNAAHCCRADTHNYI